MLAVAPVSDVSRAYPVSGVNGPAGMPTVAEGPARTEDLDFGQVLSEAVGRVNDVNNQASQQVRDLAAGATDDLHGTMIAVKEAEIGTRLLGSVRGKLLDAFHELWRTSV